MSEHSSLEDRATARRLMEVTLGDHVGKRVSLSCQVGVCIWGAMMTLQQGRGLCAWECVQGDIKIGIGVHCIQEMKMQLDGTLSLWIA